MMKITKGIISKEILDNEALFDDEIKNTLKGCSLNVSKDRIWNGVAAEIKKRNPWRIQYRYMAAICTAFLLFFTIYTGSSLIRNGIMPGEQNNKSNLIMPEGDSQKLSGGNINQEAAMDTDNNFPPSGDSVPQEGSIGAPIKEEDAALGKDSTLDEDYAKAYDPADFKAIESTNDYQYGLTIPASQILPEAVYQVEVYFTAVKSNLKFSAETPALRLWTMDDYMIRENRQPLSEEFINHLAGTTIITGDKASYKIELKAPETKGQYVLELYFESVGDGITIENSYPAVILISE